MGERAQTTRFRCLPLACELEVRHCVERQVAARNERTLRGSLASATIQFATCNRCPQGEALATAAGVALSTPAVLEVHGVTSDPTIAQRCTRERCDRPRAAALRNTHPERRTWCKQCRNAAAGAEAEGRTLGRARARTT